MALVSAHRLPCLATKAEQQAVRVCPGATSVADLDTIPESVSPRSPGLSETSELYCYNQFDNWMLGAKEILFQEVSLTFV